MWIGRAPRQSSQDLVQLLLECHQRIREFAALAVAVAGNERPEADEARQDRARVLRYFSEALPLHVADEERSILPRLMGINRRVDDALSLMQLQHRTHEAPLDELLTLFAAMQTAPSTVIPEPPGRLSTVAHDLREDFERHLALEESVVFPAIHQMLNDETQRKILAELRSRRQPMQ